MSTDLDAMMNEVDVIDNGDENNDELIELDINTDQFTGIDTDEVHSVDSLPDIDIDTDEASNYPDVPDDPRLVGSLKGKTAATIDDMYTLYVRHAGLVGFGTKRGGHRKHKTTGDVNEKYFHCICEGHTNTRKKTIHTPSPVIDDDEVYIADKNSSNGDVTRKNKIVLITRTNCKARLRIKKINEDVWEVVDHVMEHNHPFQRVTVQHLQRVVRVISTEKGKAIMEMEEAGLRPTDAFRYMVKSAGGEEHVGHTERDHINYVNRLRTKRLQGQDAQTVLDTLQKLKDEDPDFYFQPKLDDEGKLCALFWRDSMMREDYNLFGDVLIFDTTYRTNKYNLICAPFVGVNNHWNNCMFACAFIANERTESFVWLFEEFLRCMGGKKPITIFTDQDFAISKAIEEVFGDATRHRLCIWHLYQNAVSHYGSLKSNKDFKEAFDRCMMGCDNVEEFETEWESMVNTYSIDPTDSWFQRLYALREKWCTALNKDTFSAGILSSQRSESTNNSISFKAYKMTSLSQFFDIFDQTIRRWRNNELYHDFKNTSGAPKLEVNTSLVRHAAEVYSNKILAYFQSEFKLSLDTVVSRDAFTLGTRQLFEVQHNLYANNIGRVVVVWDQDKVVEITCGCMKFESVGWLCLHCLAVLHNQGIARIPDQYIHKRWTRDVKKETFDRMSKRQKTSSGTTDCIAWRHQMNRSFSELVHKSERDYDAR